MPEEVPKLLRAMIAAIDGTQADLAKRLGPGIGQPQVSRWLKGAEPSGSNYKRITELAVELGVMDLRSEDVAATLDKPPERMLRVTGHIGANGRTGFYYLAHDRYETIPGSPEDPPNAEALEIMGTSAGRWFDRGYVVINERREGVSPDMIGKPCVVWLEDGRVLFKEIRKNGALFDLLSNDEKEPTIEKVRIKAAARVLRVIPR